MNGFHLEETYASCPYDPIHRIRLCKMQFHLTKCAKNFPDVKLVTCPFYSSHKYRAEKQNEHLETCEYRQNFNEFLVERKKEEKYEPRVIPTSRASHETESWDDCYSVSYNPLKHLESNPIRRKMMVEPKSKKKQFRREEEIRYMKLLEDMKELNVNETPAMTTSRNSGTIGDGNNLKLKKKESGSSSVKKEVSFAGKTSSSTTVTNRALSAFDDGDGDDDDDDTASYTTETQSIVTTATNQTAKTAETVTSSTTTTKSDYGKQRKLVLGVNFNLANGSTTKAPSRVKNPFETRSVPTVTKKPDASIKRSGSRTSPNRY